MMRLVSTYRSSIRPHLLVERRASPPGRTDQTSVTPPHDRNFQEFAVLRSTIFPDGTAPRKYFLVRRRRKTAFHIRSLPWWRQPRALERNGCNRQRIRVRRYAATASPGAPPASSILRAAISPKTETVGIFQQK